MAISLILFLVFVESTAQCSLVEAHLAPRRDSSTCRASLLGEIQEAKLKLAQLESNLEKSIQDLNGKSLYIKECDKKIEEMTQDTHSLGISLASLEDDHSHANQKLSTLQGELRLLWSASRKNNFEIHTLEYKVQDAEKRLNVVKSQVKEIAEIISEQWIQIQQLEQAVQMAQFRALKVKRQLRSARCPFVKFINNVFGERIKLLNWMLDPYLYGWVSTLESCISEAPHFLRKTFSAAKHYHHQLQGYIKQSMLRNEITAVLVNEEVVFFVASALITFPVLCVFVLLPSLFR